MNGIEPLELVAEAMACCAAVGVSSVPRVLSWVSTPVNTMYSLVYLDL